MRLTFGSFNPVSEVHRVMDTLKSNRPFEREVFNANMMVQPDLFRIEMRNTKHKWMSPQGFNVS